MGLTHSFALKFFSQNKVPLLCTLRALAPLQDDPVPALLHHHNRT